MRCFGPIVIILIAGSFCGLPPARAQSSVTAALSSQVRAVYEPPADQKFAPIYQALAKRRVLERLQEFLSPLRLPKVQVVRVAQCGTDKVRYQSGGPVTICFELVQKIINIATENAADQHEWERITYGTFVEAALHNLAYAVVDQLDVPVWGREDDAADRMAALIMMQFGDEVASMTIKGTAKFFEYSNQTWTGADFASVLSPEAQRFYNYLCIAFGGDPITFGYLVSKTLPLGPSLLPIDRARGCSREYEQVRHAFDQRIMPYVEPDLMIKVRASQWLALDELPQDQLLEDQK
jgi:hypothetical protein